MRGISSPHNKASEPSPSENPSNDRRLASLKIPALILGLLAVATWLILCTRPDPDTDLWWQMAYGRQMLSERTLIPDHSIYTWTPTTRNPLPYCAWLAEIFLYLLHKVGGLSLLYLFRYACIGLLVGSVYVYARTCGVVDHPLVWLLCLLALLMSQMATLLRPQIISFVLMIGAVLAWLHVRSRQDDGWLWCYLFPLIMLLWINSHGGFIVGMAFYVTIGLGEELNALYSTRVALSLKLRRHLILALILSGLTVFATPYGLDYLTTLSRDLANVSPRHMNAIAEYHSIFSPSHRLSHYLEFGVASVAVLVPLFIRRTMRRGMDWALLLVLAVFGYFYCKYMRTTIFWPPLVALIGTALTADEAAWRRANGKAPIPIVSVLFVVLGCLFFARFTYDRITMPAVGCWNGLGISYINPVEESVYIDEHHAGCRLGNDYNTGSYLLWRLWPKTKTFIDARHFPFVQWFDRYLELENTTRIGEFLAKNQADVWCFGFVQRKLIAWFLESPNWVPAFYGACGAVFVRRDLATPEQKVRSGPGLDSIKNLNQGLLVLTFALNTQDWPGTERILAGMEKYFVLPSQREVVVGARSLQKGLVAFHGRRYDEAVQYLTASRKTLPEVSASLLKTCFTLQAANEWTKGDSMAALVKAQSALSLVPNDVQALYNVGVINWYRSAAANDRIRSGSAGGILEKVDVPPKAWKEPLEKFLSLAVKETGVPAVCIDVANEILIKGKLSQRPPLFIPKTPDMRPRIAAPAECPPCPAF